MRIGGNFTQESGGVAAFSNCFTMLGGGCLAVEQSVYLAGSSTFQSCKASGGSTGNLGPGVLKYCRDHERRSVERSLQRVDNACSRRKLHCLKRWRWLACSPPLLSAWRSYQLRELQGCQGLWRRNASPSWQLHLCLRRPEFHAMLCTKWWWRLCKFPCSCRGRCKDAV